MNDLILKDIVTQAENVKALKRSLRSRRMRNSKNQQKLRAGSAPHCTKPMLPEINA